jgi:hypothetical protein
MHRARIASFAVTPGGDWLALDWPDRLLRRVGGHWEELRIFLGPDVSGYPGLPYYTVPEFLATTVDQLYLAHANGVLQFADTTAGGVSASKAVRR